MRRKTNGQSLVEMAFILPVLLLLLFAIIDMGYYIYGYATIYQAARNGAREAAGLPPGPSRVSPARTQPDTSDACVQSILERVQSDATLFPDLLSSNAVVIHYPGERELGEPIEVRITYNVEPLTPLWRLVTIGNNGRMTIQATARRSIEAMGNNPNSVNLTACQPE